MRHRPYLLHIAWTLSFIAVSGSLFFSEIMNLPPCVLCWYQRIAMYPLALILPAGILAADSGIRRYALLLSVSGLGIALYHVLLYYGIIPDSITPCTQGISCTSRQIEWLGFITIPLLSLIAFVLITFCLYFYRPATKGVSS